MTTDFKATQVQTNKIIVTGSFANDGSNQLLIYNHAADDTGTPNQGVIDLTKFDTTSGIGSDVFLFVSGGVATRNVGMSYGVTVIGGDLHVSGNLSVDGTSPGGGGGGNNYWESTIAGEIFATGSLGAAITGSFRALYLSSSNGLQITGSFTHGTGTIAATSNSHAQGDSTVALGNYSHSEGAGAAATGDASHAEGVLTIASELASHAEGGQTIASGPAAHSEGGYTQAIGTGSHAEGWYTVAGDKFSHAEGGEAATQIFGYRIFAIAPDGTNPTDSVFTLEAAYGDVSTDLQNVANEFGYQIVTDGDASITGDRRIYYFANSSWDTTNTHLTCSNLYDMDPLGTPYAGSIVAFRTINFSNYIGTPPDQLITGSMSHVEGLRSVAIGSGSHAEGFRTLAIGVSREISQSPGDPTYGAHSEGRQTIAYGNASHAEGFNSIATGDYSHAEGNSTFTSGSWSHSEGNSTYASGSYSHAEGDDTLALGEASHAEGYFSIAEGSWSHAEGNNTRTPGFYSHAEGFETKASGSNSHAEGRTTYAVEDYSHAEGELTYASGSASHSEGYATRAVGNWSHAEGDGTKSIGLNSHAEGFSTIASGTNSHAEGTLTYTSGTASHAEGAFTLALGNSSHSEGYFTTGSGVYSHAEGSGSIAFGSASHAGGIFTIASGTGQTVFGKYNSRGNLDSLFIIGNGDEDTDTNRSDILLVNSQSVMVGSGTLGTDVFFYVSGTAGSKDGTEAGTAVFCGDVSISGTLYGGSPLKIGSSLLITGSVSQGTNAQASGIFSYAHGENSVASNDYAHAQGNSTTASGLYAHAEGAYTTALGEASHAEGDNTQTLGDATHAEGEFTFAYGNYSHAEGRYTLSEGVGSHSEGHYTTGSGDYAHAEGHYTIAEGYYSHAEGSVTKAIGSYSHASGFKTVASGTYQTVIGKGNLLGNDFSLFVIGDGEPFIGEPGQDNISRSDIVRVNLGASPGSGSFEVTGTIRSTLGFSGSLTQLTDGTPYLIAGTGIQTSTGSNGAVTISSTEGGGGKAAKYPDAASAVLAWNFDTVGLPIPNIGTAGSGANLTVAVNTPTYNVPGPVNAGVQFSSKPVPAIGPPTLTPTIHTAEGLGVNLGSASFTTAMTVVAFFDLSTLTPRNDFGSLFYKHSRLTTVPWAPPFAVVGVDLDKNNQTLITNIGNTLATPNLLLIPFNLESLGSSYRTGYHMIGLTFEGGTALRVYWDGLEIGAKTAGVPGTVDFANPDGPGAGEGPWSFGAIPNPNMAPSGFANCWDNRMYAFRAYNNVKSAAWMRQAWLDANGWPGP